MMNPRTFCVHELAKVESAKRAGYYVDSLLDRRKLSRLFRGEIEVLRALGMLLLNARTVVQNRLARIFDRSAAGVADVPGSLAQLAERGVDTLLLVAAHDPGIEYVDLHFGARMRALESRPNFRRVDIRGTDHTFTSRFAQQLVAEMVTGHLSARHL